GGIGRGGCGGVVVRAEHVQVRPAGALLETRAQLPGVTDGLDGVRAGQRPEVHEDRLTGEADRRVRGQTLIVDGDRLRAGGPQPVGDDLQVAGLHPALVRSPGARVAVGAPPGAVGVVEGDGHSRSLDLHHTGGDAQRLLVLLARLDLSGGDLRAGRVDLALQAAGLLAPFVHRGLTALDLLDEVTPGLAAHVLPGAQC